MTRQKQDKQHSATLERIISLITVDNKQGRYPHALAKEVSLVLSREERRSEAKYVADLLDFGEKLRIALQNLFKEAEFSVMGMDKPLDKTSIERFFLSVDPAMEQLRAHMKVKYHMVEADHPDVEKKHYVLPLDNKKTNQFELLTNAVHQFNEFMKQSEEQERILDRNVLDQPKKEEEIDFVLKRMIEQLDEKKDRLGERDRIIYETAVRRITPAQSKNEDVRDMVRLLELKIIAKEQLDSMPSIGTEEEHLNYHWLIDDAREWRDVEVMIDDLDRLLEDAKTANPSSKYKDAVQELKEPENEADQLTQSGFKLT